MTAQTDSKAIKREKDFMTDLVLPEYTALEVFRSNKYAADRINIQT
jgi:hypothetical protein